MHFSYIIFTVDQTGSSEVTVKLPVLPPRTSSSSNPQSQSLAQLTAATAPTIFSALILAIIMVIMMKKEKDRCQKRDT